MDQGGWSKQEAEEDAGMRVEQASRRVKLAWGETEAFRLDFVDWGLRKWLWLSLDRENGELFDIKY